MQYGVDIWNMFAALEDLDAEVDINSSCETNYMELNTTWEATTC
jgi:hypothetical protein